MPQLLEKVEAINHWVGGASRGSDSDRTGKVWNPGTGQQIGAVSLPKVVTSRWPDPGTSKIDLGFPQVR